MDQISMRETAQRLVTLRGDILKSYPFFGRLLLRIPFAFSDCETACTDMRKIMFDPAFAKRLDDKQLCFVILHELMHCVLKHCTRSRGKLQNLYNIACDIVVNSIVLEAMHLKEIEIDGVRAMHLSLTGKEGRKCSAEELYEEFLKVVDEEFMKVYGVSIFDSHTIWENLTDDSMLEEMWDSYVKKAGKGADGSSGIPASIERYISGIYHTPKISWRQVLHDYIQNDRSDYVFSKPDTRYSGDFILPSFQQEVDGSKIEKVHFFIDTSGSVENVAIAEAFEEIKDAVEQIGNMSGMISFFDSQVSEPIPFEQVSDIEKLRPIGGGGTDFERIFAHVSAYEEEDVPTVIIIMTDGYAPFPDESKGQGIPVIWLIIDSEVNSPWGECLHVYTDEM